MLKSAKNLSVGRGWEVWRMSRGRQGEEGVRDVEISRGSEAKGEYGRSGDRRVRR